MLLCTFDIVALYYGGHFISEGKVAALIRRGGH